MKDLAAIAQGEVTAAALTKITGATPTVQYMPDHVKISFNGPALGQAQQWVEKTLSASPGSVRIDILPVVLPYALKTYAPYAVAALAAAYLIGAKLGKKK